jgi:ribosomal protein S12 methylthiotransferase accessory factor
MKVEVTFPGGKRVHAHLGDFVVETDQPFKSGGAGSAPGPYDLFLASIAACAGYYALAFCQARGIPTAGLHLVEHSDLDPDTGIVRAFRLELTLPVGFPPKYRTAIVRAVENCKVKKAIAGGPSFTVALADERIQHRAGA